MLTRDQILQANDLPRVEVQVPEWGGSVFVRMMTGLERDRFESDHVKDASRRNFRARLAALTVCDEGGAILFSEADVSTLGAKSCAALDRIFEASARLNRLMKEDYEALGKDSKSTPSDSSPTGSP